jgi:hypothetical protein
METLVMTRKKSEPLTGAEQRKLKSYRKQFAKSTDCASSIGIDRNVLERLLLTGSAAPDTIEKIRAVIGKTTK